MNTTSLRRNLGILAGLSLVLSVAADAAADQAISPVVSMVQTGTNAGPQEADGGPGFEQPTVTYLQKDGKTYIVTIYMSSKVSEEDAAWQCECSSMVLSPDGAPAVAADQVQLTFNRNGDRHCNHPKAASDGERVVWLFGTDEDSNNTETYVSAVDEMCNVLMEPKQVSTTNGNNNGAPDISYNGMNAAGNHVFTGGYLSTNNNDTSYAMGLEVTDLGGGQVDVDRTYLEGVVAPSNIGRPSIVRVDDDTSIFCASQGNNRPPEDGVRCALLNNTTGEVIHSQIIAASQPAQKKYMNQPTVVRLENGNYALRVLESSGEGKTNNKKGSNKAHDYIISPQSESFLIAAHEENLGNYPTHSSTCAGEYGLEGRRHFGVFAAAITGNSQPLVQFFAYAGSEIQKDPTHNTWVAGWYADAGKLANLYGHNPGTQGRDFMRCIGDVPNPGFNQPNGFYPSVKSFFVLPHAGRVPGEEKNSGWLTLVPGATSQILTPAPPASVDDVETGTQGEKPTESEPPGPSEEPTEPGTDEPKAQISSTSGGCATAGSSGSPAAAALLIGLALALSSRRRKDG
jgi:MYXO-CTERM domain-containing protein